MELNEKRNGVVNQSFQGSADNVSQVQHNEKQVKAAVEPQDDDETLKTSYMETMLHLFKGNVGTGCFAMADAMKNGGLLLGPVLALFLGVICVHAQHILLTCSAKMEEKFKLTTKPDYAETVELCFVSSNNKRWQKIAPHMKTVCNVFICITQLGFCCIYFLFVATNLKQVLDFYGFHVGLHTLVTFSLIPIWLSALITNLKYLVPLSGVASVCMIAGIVITYFYASQDLPPITERHFVPASLHSLPLFFGTAIFSFEGIALVLPLQNAMKKPKMFARSLGVLNVGMVFVTAIYISFGAIGYWKYGDETRDSLTLNLPTNEKLAQFVKLTIALGVLLGYAIQFFIAIQIMLPRVIKTFNFTNQHPMFGEFFFRTVMVLLTFTVAEVVPNLGLLLSLIGAVCSTVLALVLPPILEFIVLSRENDRVGWMIISKNSIILLISLLGFLTGGYESLSGIVRAFFS